MTAVRFGKVVRWSAAVAVAVLFFLHPELAFAQEDGDDDYTLPACSTDYPRTSGSLSAAGSLWSSGQSSVNFPGFRYRWRLASCDTATQGEAHLLRFELDLQAQQSAQGSPVTRGFVSIPDGWFAAWTLGEFAGLCPSAQCNHYRGGYQSFGGASGQADGEVEGEVDVEIITCHPPFRTDTPTPDWPFHCDTLHGLDSSFGSPVGGSRGHRTFMSGQGYPRCFRYASDVVTPDTVSADLEIPSFVTFRCGGDDLEFTDDEVSGGGSFSGRTHVTVSADFGGAASSTVSAELSLVASGGITLEAGDSTINIETGITVNELVSVASEVEYNASLAVDVSLSQTLQASLFAGDTIVTSDVDVTLDITVSLHAGATARDLADVLSSVFATVATDEPITLNLDDGLVSLGATFGSVVSSLALSEDIEGLGVTVSVALQEIGEFLQAGQETQLEQLGALEGIVGGISSLSLAVTIGGDGDGILTTLFGDGGGGGNAGTLAGDYSVTGLAVGYLATLAGRGIEGTESGLSAVGRQIFQQGIPQISVQGVSVSEGACPDSAKYGGVNLAVSYGPSLCGLLSGGDGRFTEGRSTRYGAVAWVSRCYDPTLGVLGDRGRGYIWDESRATSSVLINTPRRTFSGDVPGFNPCRFLEGPDFHFEPIFRALSLLFLTLVPFFVFTGRM